MNLRDLFLRWRRQNPDAKAETAWMSGYAAACHHAFLRGRDEGIALAERERRVLLRAVHELLRSVGEAPPPTPAEGHDARDDTYLLAKLLAEAKRHRLDVGSAAD